MKHMYYDVKTSDTCVSQLEASLAVRQKWQSNIQNILLVFLCPSLISKNKEWNEYTKPIF